MSLISTIKKKVLLTVGLAVVLSAFGFATASTALAAPAGQPEQQRQLQRRGTATLPSKSLRRRTCVTARTLVDDGLLININPGDDLRCRG